MARNKVRKFKVNSLPVSLQPSSVYYVKNGDKTAIYVSDRDGNLLYSTVSGTSSSSSDKNYEHIQSIPASVWAINHGLNKRPSVTILDSSGKEVEGAVTQVDSNNIIIEFSAPFSGRATLN